MLNQYSVLFDSEFHLFDLNASTITELDTSG